jgi:hypothetical protein
MAIADRRKRAAILLSTAALPRPLRVAVRAHLLARLELRRARRAELLIIGHPKSGNTWLRTMLSRLYQGRYGLPSNLIVKSDELARAAPGAPRLLATNAHYSYEGAVGRRLAADAPLGDLHRKKAVFLVRHPCDIAVSWYLQCTKRQSPAKRELIDHFIRRPIDRGTISRWDFVRHPEVGLPFLIDYLNTWERNVARMPRAITVRYEELRGRPAAALRRVVDLLDPTFTDEEIAEAVAFASFENLRALEARGFFRRGGLARRDPADPESFKVRRGKPRGYRNDLPPEQLAEMDALVAARLSPTLGYTAAPPSRRVPLSS